MVKLAWINHYKSMARKRKRGRPRKQILETAESRFALSPETKHSILVIFLLAAAVIIILSMFGLTGQTGAWILKGLKIFMGKGYGFFPLLMFGVGLLLFNPQRYFLTGLNYLGIVILLLAYSGLFHISIPLNESWLSVKEGLGGGLVGWSATYPLLKVMDFWGTLVTLLAALLVGIFLTFNISIQDIRNKGSQTKNLWSRLTSWLFMKMNREEIESVVEVEDEDEVDDVFEEDEAETYEDDYQATEDSDNHTDSDISLVTQEQKKILKVKKSIQINLPIKLLDVSSEIPRGGDIELRKEKIKQTLDNFDIDVEMDKVSVGPTVTQYTLIPAEGVRLSKIVNLQNDLALALAAHPIRIEAPIPGKSLVGIEVPNKHIAKVSLREVIDTRQFKQTNSPLPFAVGKDVAGQAWILDLDAMPHILIAGATGSGKSVAINCLILSLLYRNNPDDLKFIMVDPKRVELTLYNNIPYLLTPVITDVQKTINSLRWATMEMDKRYQQLNEVGKRNIAAYNSAQPDSKMPYIVIIIDELADLMSVAAQEVEGLIVRLAQMARAVGIHLVLATQRPSVDVITGLIKANITARVAFAVASQTDSRTILDMAGAEKLLGRGDMLLTTAQLSKPKRLQGAFVSEEEVLRLTNYIKSQVTEVEYMEEVIQPKKSIGLPGDYSGDETDSMLTEARRLVIEAGRASASYLQRRLRIGYSRAARLLDILEEEGTIGPADGARPREVLVSSADFDVADVREQEENDDEFDNENHSVDEPTDQAEKY